MAHLWIANTADEWVVEPLDAGFVVLVADPAVRPEGNGGEGDPRSVVLVRAPGTNVNGDPWVLMAGVAHDVRVNGFSVAGGIRVLGDRDEIYVAGRRRYFSTETLARVTACPGRSVPPLCPRCQQAIEAGAAAVSCPHCGVWHHELASLPCWTYTDTCAVCPQPTDLSAGYRWTPEREDR